MTVPDDDIARMLAEEGDAAEIGRDWDVPMVRARRRPWDAVLDPTWHARQQPDCHEGPDEPAETP